jgi:hypothetical protein
VTLQVLAVLVREYLGLIDRASDLPPYELLDRCAKLLPRIYVAGLELPDIEPDDAAGPPSVDSPIATLATRLGRYDHYWEVFDPYVDEPAVVGSLSDDLADIYIDLAAALLEYDAGRIANAHWMWRFDLHGHAGDHLVDALRALHRLMHDRMKPDFDPAGDAA